MVIVRAIYSVILIAGGVLCLATNYLQAQRISLFLIFALLIVRGGYELNKARKAIIADVWEETLYLNRSKKLIFYYLFHVIFVLVGIVNIRINYQDQLPPSGFLIGLSFIIFGFLGLTDTARYIRHKEKEETIAKEKEKQEQERKERSNNTGKVNEIDDFPGNKIIEIKDKYRAKRKKEFQEKIKKHMQVSKKIRLNKILKLKKGRLYFASKERKGKGLIQENLKRSMQTDQEKASQESFTQKDNNQEKTKTYNQENKAIEKQQNKVIDFTQAKNKKSQKEKKNKENNSI